MSSLIGRFLRRLGEARASRWIISGVVIITGVNLGYLLIVRPQGESLAADFESIEFVEQSGAVTLAEYGRGSCRYVVFANPDCASCQSAARVWTRETLEGSVSLPNEADWSVIWLVTQGAPSIERLGLEDASFDVLPLVDDARAIDRTALQAFPWFVVLNREGEVVSHGPGARLPESEDFLVDCSLREPQGADLEVIG